MARKAGLTIGAQAISSLTNFLASALALSVGTLQEFGRFSIVFQLCVVVLAVGQGSTGTSILIHGSQHSDVDELGRIYRGTASAAMIIGGASMILLLIAAVVVEGGMANLLLLSAFGAPGLVCQYTYRSARYARLDYSGVVILDLIWLGVLVAVAAVGWLTSWEPAAADYLLAWLIGGTVSAAPFMIAGLRGTRDDLAHFWRVTGPQTVKHGFDNLLARSVLMVTLISTAWILDDTASGSLAAATLLFSPLTIVMASTTSIVAPSEIRKRGVHVVRRTVPIMLIAATTVITVGWAVTLLAVDEMSLAAGPFSLSTNNIGMGLFLATLLRFLAFAFWRGSAAAFRIADAASESLDIRLKSTALQWLLPVIGLWLGGLTAGAMAFAIATWIGAYISWRRYLRLTVPATGA